MQEQLSEQSPEQMETILQRARERFKIPYLYPFQRLVVSNILETAWTAASRPSQFLDQDRESYSRQIVILPTGSGKSFCYLVPALIVPGITLVLSPLRSLITDQLRRLKERDIPAAALVGNQPARERQQIWKALDEKRVKILYSNPETLTSPSVLQRLEPFKVSHLVVDEAHTLPEWGESFRPALLQTAALAQRLSPTAITAFTATASPLILQKIKQLLFPDGRPHLIQGNPDRPNIFYKVIPCLSKDHELTRLFSKANQSGSRKLHSGPVKGKLQPPVRRPAIIFCASRPGSELTARKLRERLATDEIFFYHAGLTKEERERVEQWFLSSQTGILSATCAYGMGVDKKNIRTVIHKDPPPSLESYVQESGRGGRDGAPCLSILLYSSQDLPSPTQQVAERTRYSKVMEYAQTHSVCRRHYILDFFKAPREVCFGCDVCTGTALTTPSYLAPLNRFLKKQGERYSQRELIQILHGRKTRDVQEQGLKRVWGFGLLQDWHKEEIEEVLELLKD